MPVSRVPGALAIAMALGLAAPGIAAAQHAAKSKSLNHAAEEVEVDAAGQVAIDRGNGKLRAPTADEARALADALRALVRDDTDGLREVVHANGAVGLPLEDRFNSVAVGRVENGKVDTDCVTTPREAELWLAGEEAHADAKAKATSAAPALEDR